MALNVPAEPINGVQERVLITHRRQQMLTFGDR